MLTLLIILGYLFFCYLTIYLITRFAEVDFYDHLPAIVFGGVFWPVGLLIILGIIVAKKGKQCRDD